MKSAHLSCSLSAVYFPGRRRHVSVSGFADNSFPPGYSTRVARGNAMVLGTAL
jgi:hypothetical protein